VNLAPVILLSTAATLGAQPFLFGVRGGVPITRFATAGPAGPFEDYVIHSNHYVVGGTAELRLTTRFSIAADALLGHWNYDNGGKYVPAYSNFTSRTAARNWEFPVLVRYRFLRRKTVAPFVSAGAAADWLHLEQVQTVDNFITGLSTSSTGHPPELRRSLTAGIVVGGGVAWRFGHLHVEPDQATYGTISSNRNQVEFLVGIEL
jgi:Outer membrane protein beta-barrel domain